jgi:uncharacterized membrane protein YfhO
LKRFSILLVAGCLALVGALVFRDFLFGNALLLYKDSGSDSINDYYPSFVHLSDYLRIQGLPSWSFYVGMGHDLYYLAGYVILEPVTWLPKDLIAHGLIYQHLTKVLIAGLLFYRFLQLRGVHLAASLLGSVLVAFSAYMCMGTCWNPFADEVVCFAALLLAVEIALKPGRWFVFSLAVALVGFLDAFHLYLCAIFLLLYVPARLFGQYGWQPRAILRVCLLLALAAILGVGLSSFFTLPSLYFALNSPRTSGPTSTFSLASSFPIFGRESQLHYITAALRPFANDILGTAEPFRGWQNYLEAPLSYCGLLCLILLPQIFVGATRRQRVIAGLFLLGTVTTTIFPWFRYLFWLFQGNYYRALSLFSILGTVTLSATIFSRYLEGRRFNLWLLGATTIVVVGTLFLPVEELQRRLDPALTQQATIFLLCYAGLLVVGQLLRRPFIIGAVIVALVAVELTLFDYITVSRRQVVTKDELAMRVGYNDETVDALRDIRAEDNSSFYRITKIRPSSLGVLPSLNDAMVFAYYGTPYYSSFNNINYINFLLAVEAIPPNSEIDTRYSVGLLNDSTLSLFAGEKYVLTNAPIPWQRALQYEFVKHYDKDYLFRNARFLPLGLTFARYIPEDVFLKLPTREKPEVLLRAVVFSNKDEAEKLGLSPIALPDLEQEIRMSSLGDVVATRRKTALDLTSFRQTQIEGSVTLDQQAVLVVQTPFDRGWEAWQDGETAPVLKVDIGLLGIGLDRGQHKIELRYHTPFLRLGLAIALGSLLILSLAAWRWPRLGLGDHLSSVSPDA